MQAEYKFNKKISIQPELIYTRQGSVNRGNFNGTQIDNTLRLDYLNLPILFKYYVAEGLALELGPGTSYLINAQYKTIVGPESSILEISKQFKDIDYRANIGVNYKTEWGFTIGFRYERRFIDINNGSNLETGQLYNTLLQLSFGYFFK